MFQNSKQFSLKSLSIQGIYLNEIEIKCSLWCMPCSTKPRLDFISTLPDFNTRTLSKKHFEDLCSKLTLIDVFGHMSRFHNCFQRKCISTKPFIKEGRMPGRQGQGEDKRKGGAELCESFIWENIFHQFFMVNPEYTLSNN